MLIASTGSLNLSQLLIYRNTLETLHTSSSQQLAIVSCEMKKKKKKRQKQEKQKWNKMSLTAGEIPPNSICTLQMANV